MYMGELPEIGQPDPKLVSIRRRVENSRHEYPEEQVALVGEYKLDFLRYLVILPAFLFNALHLVLILCPPVLHISHT